MSTDRDMCHLSQITSGCMVTKAGGLQLGKVYRPRSGASKLTRKQTFFSQDAIVDSKVLCFNGLQRFSDLLGLWNGKKKYINFERTVEKRTNLSLAAQQQSSGIV